LNVALMQAEKYSPKEAFSMRYMLLVYLRETEMAQWPQDDRAHIATGHRAVIEESAKRGIFRGAEPLKPTATATTVRMQGGQPLISDGPFAETKEQLAGYYILECSDLDEAIGWASKIPTACKGGDGCIEIRPIAALPRAQTGVA
jgi:hypothetical protein